MARPCDALALPTRKLRRTAVQQLLQLEDARRLADACLDLRLGAAVEAQSEAHVLEHAEMRIERVGLEHHGDTPFTRLQGVAPCVTDEEVAGGDVFQARDHAQQRGFAAAGRADEDDELLGDVEVDALMISWCELPRRLAAGRPCWSPVW